MSAPGNWGKSVQLRRKAFERRDGADAGGTSEDESGGRATERYRVQTRESSHETQAGGRSGSRTLMSPPGMRVATGSTRPQQRRTTTAGSAQQRGSLTGEYSEEGVMESDSTHTLAIGEETGQKERVEVAPPRPSQRQSDAESEREDQAMVAQISILSKQNQQLEAQLREMEQERQRLREMLAGDKMAAATAPTGDPPYTPPGLPSKVLDGRKVMKPGERGKTDRSDKHTIREDDLMAEIDDLRKSRRELEQRLHEVSEEKRRLEAELSQQKETLCKMQDREQDLSKDIETLRDENSHHSGTISRLQADHTQLHTENGSLHRELSAVSEKLNKVQKCYRQVEQENMHLAEELREMERDRVKLTEEKMKLQLSVDDGQKTKENYRLTIKKLREENTALKAKKSDAAANDDASSVIEKPRAVSKEQQAVDEMIKVRAERTQLQEQLQSAQRDIDLLRAQIKGHSLEQQATNAIKRNVTGHLKELRSQVLLVYDDLEAARTTVTALTDQQSQLARKQFETLAKKCRRELRQAVTDKMTVTRALESAKKSLAKLQIELEVVRATNAKLQSHKSVVTDDVSQLRSEVSRLQDQKKLLERQLSQNETLAQERDATVHRLETEQKKLKLQLQSSEKNLKNQLARHEQDWQDRMAEMNLVQGNLAEEREDMLREKKRVEEELKKVESEHRKLEEGKCGLEAKIGQLEGQISEMEARFAENTEEISRVRRGIVRVVVDRACSAARARVISEHTREEFTAREGELRTEIAALSQERDTLSQSLEISRRERDELEARSKGVHEREEKIQDLTNKLEALSKENESIRTEIQSLSELRQSAVDNLQQLSEAKQSLQLDNQKIHMTLRTEISLLQTKLKSVEDEKQALEARVAELSAARTSRGGGSAFQGVSGATEGGYAEGLRRQVGALQTADTRQLRRENSEKKVPSADLQSRMMMLEAENRRLKDTLRSGKEPPDSNPALRKKIIKLSQRNFFLEWEKKDLSDKLQISLRLSRETKEKAASEQEERLHEMNHALTEKVRGLEDSLLKRRSAIDTRISETVKENGRLHHQLIVLKDGFDESHRQRELVEETVRWATEDGPRVVGEIKTGLTGFEHELQEIKSRQKQMRELQSELQQQVDSELVNARGLTRTSSGSLPPVLKSLNPSYLSRLGGTTATSPPPSTPTPLPSSPSSKPPTSPQSPTVFSEVKGKFQQFSQLNAEIETAVENGLECVASQLAKQVALVGDQFAEHKQKLGEVAGTNKKLRDLFDGISERDLQPEQLQTIAMLQKQIECLEDQVIDRDAALQEIESQMKQDYEQHDQLISKLNFRVIDLRSQLSTQASKLRSKDVYLQQADSRYLELETQLISLRKEMERFAHERDQLVSQALPEHLKMVAVATGGTVSLSDVIRLQGDEIRALQNSLVEYSYQLTQLHQQLTTADRQCNTLRTKILSSERMQQQMREHSTAEINYLRTLNLQFVEQQAKGDKGKVLLEEVRKVKEALRQQQETGDVQRELNDTNIKLLEQERKINDLEFQLHTHQLSLTMLQADKQHALSSISQDMTNQIPPPHPSSGYLLPRRPMSAGSEGGGGTCRKPNYHFLNRGQTSSRNSLMQTEFAIQIPAGTKGSSEGDSDIVNLEEHMETHHNPLSLGPAVVTDDESSRFVERHLQRGHDEAKMEKVAKHQQIKKIRRHRRTASTGSNVIYIPQKDLPSSNSTTLPASVSSSAKPTHHINIVRPKPLMAKQQVSRPGSAGSNPTTDGVLHRAQSPEQIKTTAHEVMKGITKLIVEGEGGLGEGGGGGGESTGERVMRMRRVKSGGMRLGDGVSGETGGGGGEEGLGEGSSVFSKMDSQTLKTSLTSSLPIGLGNRARHKHETPRNKQSGKSSDATDPPTSTDPSLAPSNTSSPRKTAGGSSRPSATGWLRIFSGKEKNTSKSSGGASGGSDTKVTSNSHISTSATDTPPSIAAAPAVSGHYSSNKLPPTLTADLSRTPSILSTASTVSTLPPSTLPSRNPSFAYDGGGESSPHSLESVEIGDSIENLLALQSGRMNYSYFIPIRSTKEMTSSSDDDSVRGYRHSRRKRSSGTTTDATTHSSQQSKDEDNNSNSSNDSDQLHSASGSGYHRGTQSDSTGTIKTSAPVCRHESISIAAMEDCPTDIDNEVDEKAALLRKSFPRDRQGRLRTSSTGSIHICYSDSNTSMEDVSKNF